MFVYIYSRYNAYNTIKQRGTSKQTYLCTYFLKSSAALNVYVVWGLGHILIQELAPFKHFDFVLCNIFPIHVQFICDALTKKTD